MSRSFLFILFGFCFVFSSNAVSIADTIQVNTSIKPPLSTKEENGALDLLVKELFSRTGHDVQIVRLPPERALVLANMGESDVELPRVKGMDKLYPNLVRVPEEVIRYRFVGFTRDPAIRTDSWTTLKRLRAGAVRGWKIFERNVPVGASVEFVGSAKQLFKMLEHQHIDLALHEHYTGAGIVRSLGIEGVCVASPPLAVRPMYLYVHKKHTSLVPEIVQTLREMKKDGAYARAFAEGGAESCRSWELN